ncbi:ribonuclease Z, mitochondrial [Euwallacea fornicatus]|uniref:ribonuclease Z, mitochondrial n=1 Tax=Euwallacea fornicatus TaxID=995702 RepID=UPI00338D6149
MYFILKPIYCRFFIASIQRHYSKKRYSSHTKFNELLLKMPKEYKHIAEAQMQRIKIKQKSAKYAPGKVILQVLGSGAKGAPRAVYLFSDQSRYLFNCGEGTQRLAHEHKTKLSKLEHIFITQSVWKNMGGLPGTALTIQDVGVPEITLHGPNGLSDIFSATRRFVVIKDLRIRMADCSETAIFEDNVMRVKYVSLYKKKNESCEIEQVNHTSQLDNSSESEGKPTRSRSLSQSRDNCAVVEDNTDYYAYERRNSQNCNTNRVHSQSHKPYDKGCRSSPNTASTSNENLLKEYKKESISMCYICHLQPHPGALNLDKCVQKGVPPGPLLGKLKSGEDVTLADGRVVKSSEVCYPDDPGPVFIVVDCPDPEYLQSLVNSTEIRKHQKFANSNEDAACLVIHFTPAEVMKLPRYKRWMDDFCASCEHIPINELNTCMGSVAVHRIQYKLNMLSSSIFPLLGDKGTPVIHEVNQDLKTKLDISDHSFKYIGGLSSYHLRPKKGFDRTSGINLDVQEFLSETSSLPDFPIALRDLQQTLEMSRAKLNIKEFPKLLFLGTGSCIPNKTRNTSGILLQTSETSNILMDCGEGTYGQILRFFGTDKGNEILTNIDAIYISHLHADHHIGLLGLLQGRRRALNILNIDKQPLYLIAPRQILAWLTFYDKCFETIEDEYVLIPNDSLLLNQHTYPEEKLSKVLSDLQFSDINTCFVRHCPNAFGVSILHKSGYKLTYSGDTMPSQNLVHLGQNSDVLIHEATMEDDLSHEAVVKMHSTTSQAIEIGQDMNAKHIVLTHFSQRYAKLPRFNDNFGNNVSIAFDNMQVKLDELPLVPLFYPALKIMFAEHYEEMETKAIKRQLKSERQASLERIKMKKTTS